MVKPYVRHLIFLGITLIYLLIIVESIVTINEFLLGSGARIVGSTMLFIFFLYKFYPDMFKKVRKKGRG